MDSAEEKYAAFDEKVKRNVYVDNLSPLVTEAVLKTAFNQFGNVEKVEFIANFTQLRSTSRCALVEMQNPKQASLLLFCLQVRSIAQISWLNFQHLPFSDNVFEKRRKLAILFH